MDVATSTPVPSWPSTAIDPNYAAQQAVMRLLTLVPEVGTLLSALVAVFWPSTKLDPWAEVESKVQALVNQSLSTLVQQQVKASLSGLNSNLSSYLVSLTTSQANPSFISEKWNVANGQFLQQLGSFQLADYQLLLSPYFAQFANMHLSLLRDGVVFGAGWGWTPQVVAQTQLDLSGAIDAYSGYASQIYEQGLEAMVLQAPNDPHLAEPFRTTNAFTRTITLTLLDYQTMWPFFDPSKYPNGAQVALVREIYSDPQGSCDDSGNILVPTAPSQPIQAISVWGWDRIDAVQVTYPTGGGPGGCTLTSRMGNAAGGVNTAPHGGVFQVAESPVTTAGGLSGDIVNALTFTFTNGKSTGKLGGIQAGGGTFSWSFPGHIMSSVWINGVSTFYGSADCIVFGFKYADQEEAPAQVADLLTTTGTASPADAAQSAAHAAWWSELARRAA